MKKIISLIMAIMMCLSLCACGGGNDTPKANNDKDPYVGTWETEQLRLVITKGGVGRWGGVVDGKDFEESSFAVNWEVKDEIMVVTWSVAGWEFNAAFELNESETVLNEIQKSGAFSGDVEDDTEYVKVS